MHKLLLIILDNLNGEKGDDFTDEDETQRLNLQVNPKRTVPLV